MWHTSEDVTFVFKHIINKHHIPWVGKYCRGKYWQIWRIVNHSSIFLPIISVIPLHWNHVSPFANFLFANWFRLAIRQCFNPPIFSHARYTVGINISKVCAVKHTYSSYTYTRLSACKLWCPALQLIGINAMYTYSSYISTQQ